MKLMRAFTEHPATVGETYWQHMGFALRFGGRMVAGGLACLVHGLLPFLFVTRGSETVLSLYERLRRDRPARVAEASLRRTQGT